MVAVNQLGVMLGMNAVVDPMRRAGGGGIVDIASIAGVRGEPDMLAYTGTKFAIQGMAQVVAAELAAADIGVNVINPGVIDTPMIRQNTEERARWLSERVPLGRFGKPEEAARAALFPASDEPRTSRERTSGSIAGSCSTGADRPGPERDPVAGEPAEAVAAARAAVGAPDGIGTLTSYATEVALPMKGTCRTTVSRCPSRPWSWTLRFRLTRTPTPPRRA